MHFGPVSLDETCELEQYPSNFPPHFVPASHLQFPPPPFHLYRYPFACFVVEHLKSDSLAFDCDPRQDDVLVGAQGSNLQDLNASSARRKQGEREGEDLHGCRLHQDEELLPLEEAALEGVFAFTDATTHNKLKIAGSKEKKNGRLDC